MSVIHKEKYFTSLPQPYYTSEEIYRREIEKVWHAQWLLAGHVSMIPNKGDYFTYELDTDSVIVVRGEGSAVHAHYNTCRHRGFRICEAGSSRAATCPAPTALSTSPVCAAHSSST